MGLLDRFLGRAPQLPHHAVVMVLLPDIAPPDGARVLGRLREHWGPVLPAIDDEQHDAGLTSAAIPGGRIGLAHMPAPVPAEALDGPVALAWHWPDAESVVAAHRSHVIVHAGSTTLGRIPVRLLLTRLAAAIAAEAPGSAVYVGDAMLVRSAEDYQEDAATASADEPPVLSWVGFNLAAEDDGRLSAYTTGLSGFGLLELEARDLVMAEPEVVAALADIAFYQLRTGRTLKDGDTVGVSAAERTRVRHQPSRFIPDMTVAVLELGAAGGAPA